MGRWHWYTLREDVLIHALEDAGGGGDPVLIAMELLANAGITIDDDVRTDRENKENGIIAISMTLPTGGDHA